MDDYNREPESNPTTLMDDYKREPESNPTTLKDDVRTVEDMVYAAGGIPGTKTIRYLNPAVEKIIKSLVVHSD